MAKASDGSPSLELTPELSFYHSRLKIWGPVWGAPGQSLGVAAYRLHPSRLADLDFVGLRICTTPG